MQEVRKPYQLKLITAPASEPVDVTAAKLAARIDIDDDDTLVEAYIQTAREWCEQYQKERAYFTQTWELSYDRYPVFPIEIPKYPVQSITSIKYFVEDGTSTGAENTWASSNYFVDLDSIPARISLSEVGNLPIDDLVPLGGFKIRFVAGESSVDDIPETIKTAIKLTVAHLYENREAVLTGTIASELPFGVKALLGIDRW